MSDDNRAEYDPTRRAYPDPTVPIADPAAAMPSGQPTVNGAPEHLGYGTHSAFAGTSSAPPAGIGGLAIVALVVGIIAFLLGWIPVFGIIAGLIGIVLGIVAVRRPAGRVLSIIGLVLSGLAFITGVIMTLVVFVLFPTGAVYLPSM